MLAATNVVGGGVQLLLGEVARCSQPFRLRGMAEAALKPRASRWISMTLAKEPVKCRANYRCNSFIAFEKWHEARRPLVVASNKGAA